MDIFFHPAFVHFPIAFAFFECGLLIAWALRHDEGTEKFASWTGRAGFFSMIPAAVSGFVSLGGFKKIDAASWPHVLAVLILFGWWTCRLLSERYFKGRKKSVVLAGSVVTCALVILTAYRGARLVY